MNTVLEKPKEEDIQEPNRPLEKQQEIIRKEGMQKATTRLSLDLTPQMNAVIDDLTSRMGGTRAQLIRRAISLLKIVMDAEPGETLALIKDGKITTKIAF